MAEPTVFDLCRPREDDLQWALPESEFADGLLARASIQCRRGRGEGLGSAPFSTRV